MINLHPLKYAHVPVEFSEATPWIFFAENWDRIKENALWIEQKKSYPAQELNNEQILKNISLLSKGNIQKPFITPQEYDEWHTSADLNLLTERSYGPPEVTIGSSRHVLLKDVHLKGVGRNLLAISGSRFHSTGEFLYRDALHSLIIEQILTVRSSIKPLATFGLLLPSGQDVSKAPRVIQIRECDSFRLSQLHPAFLTKHDQQIARLSLENAFPRQTGEEIFKLITSNLLKSFFEGICHTSLSPENLLLNGRWLDCESIALTLDRSPSPLSVELIIPADVFGKMKSEHCDFLTLTQHTHQFSIRTSWIHDFKLIYTFYHQVLSALFQTKIVDPIIQLINDLKAFNLDTVLWSTLLKETCLKENYYLPLSAEPRILPLDIVDSLKSSISDYKIVGMNTSPDLKFVFLKLSNIGVSPKDDFVKRFSKFEALFYPKVHDLNQAFAIGESIKKIRAGYL